MKHLIARLINQLLLITTDVTLSNEPLGKLSVCKLGTSDDKTLQIHTNNGN